MNDVRIFFGRRWAATGALGPGTGRPLIIIALSLVLLAARPAAAAPQFDLDTVEAMAQPTSVAGWSTSPVTCCVRLWPRTPWN